MPSIVPLNNVTHKEMKVLQDVPLASMQTRHLLPILIGEFSVVSGFFPILFVKDKDTGQFRSTVLCGLQPQENLFYHDSQWQAQYLPVSVRPSPFVALPKNTGGDGGVQDELILCIDEDSKLLSKDVGHRLFDDNGEQTEYLQGQSRLAADIRVQLIHTEGFIDKLLEFSLLKSNPVKVSPSQGQEFTLSGMYTIDERVLQELDTAQFLELRKQGYLPGIYASLISLLRFDDLLQRKELRMASSS